MTVGAGTVAVMVEPDMILRKYLDSAAGAGSGDDDSSDVLGASSGEHIEVQFVVDADEDEWCTPGQVFRGPRNFTEALTPILLSRKSTECREP